MLQDKLCHRTQALIFKVNNVDHRSKHGYGNSELLEGQERSAFALKHDTVSLSFMYTDLSRNLLLKWTCWSEVNDFINRGVRLAKEAARIKQQKKQFQHTGQDTVEVMNDMFSIENWKMCSVYFHRYHSQTTWVEKFKSYIFYERGKHWKSGAGARKRSFVWSRKVLLRSCCIVCFSIGY